MNPEAKFPSLTLPMKKPDNQLWNIIPASIIDELDMIPSLRTALVNDPNAKAGIDDKVFIVNVTVNTISIVQMKGSIM